MEAQMCSETSDLGDTLSQPSLYSQVNSIPFPLILHHNCIARTYTGVPIYPDRITFLRK